MKQVCFLKILSITNDFYLLYLLGETHVIAHGREKNPTIFSKQFMVGVFCCGVFLLGFLFGFFFVVVVLFLFSGCEPKKDRLRYFDMIIIVIILTFQGRVICSRL